MIPVNRPILSKNTKKYINKCLKSGWLSSEGPFVEEFEFKFAKYIGVKFATTTNSGTSALHLALLALGIGPGDEVIVPALTIASCYFAVWYCGAKAIPADVDPETYTVTATEIKKHLTQKTKAVMPVHLYGHPCDMDPILVLAKKHNLFVVEDAAEAHGAEYKGKKVGSLGDAACFSFYANKLVTCGEGGMVVSNNRELIEKVRRLKNLNHVPKKRFTHLGIGYKLVMSNLQAAVGIASLEDIESSIKYKREMAKLYNNHLINTEGIDLPIEKSWAKSIYWMFAIRNKEKEFGINKEALMKRLEIKFGIQTRSFFYSPSIAFQKMNRFQSVSFPIAERISREGFYLPSGLGNTNREFNLVCSALNKIKREILS